MGIAVTRVWVEKGLSDSTLTQTVLNRVSGAAVERFDDLPGLLALLERLPAAEAKRQLVIACRRGGYVKDFPVGPGIRPAGWKYFIPAVGCSANCSYCFLRVYHPANAPVLFARQEMMLAEIKTQACRGGYFYGGELCDNLMLEEYLGVVGPLVALFRKTPAARLELRTKSDKVEPLLQGGAAQNVIVSWTFSPDDVVRQFEFGTAPLESRIRAARQLQDAGFRIGIRLDPIVLSDGWRGRYRRLVEAISSELDPRKVESVHLGCLRYPAALKAASRDAGGAQTVFAGEFVPSTDGKFRYPRPLRAAAYAETGGLFRKWYAPLHLTLVMETIEVHSEVEQAPACGK